MHTPAVPAPTTSTMGESRKSITFPPGKRPVKVTKVPSAASTSTTAKRTAVGRSTTVLLRSLSTLERIRAHTQARTPLKACTTTLRWAKF